MVQWVVVDDSDPSISYSNIASSDGSAEQWGSVIGSIPGDVDLDNAVCQTGHVLSSNGSISFIFNGTQVEVFGVSSQLNLSKTDHTHNASWTCSIDNIPIPINASALSGFPWTGYCGQDGLLDNGPHILNISITATQQRRFWLDYIRYVPFSSTPVANQTLLVNATDPAISYPPGTQWNSVATAQFTETDPSTVSGGSPDAVSMSYTFNGTGLTWFGLALQSIVKADNAIPGAFPAIPEIVLVTMDGVLQNVSISNKDQTDPAYSHVLFSYDSLDPTKEHTLTATYKADNSTPPMSTPPLTLDFLLVQTGPLVGADAPSADPAHPNSDPPAKAPDAAAKKSNSHAGPIVGAVLGALLVLLLFILLLRFRRRRQISARRARPHPSKTMGFVQDTPEPYNDTHTREYESFPMRTADADPFSATAPPSSLLAKSGSRFVEDRSIAEPSIAEPMRAATTPELFIDSPRQTVHSFPSISRSQTTPADFTGSFTGSRAPSQTPSVNTVTNPFRRINQASPSLDAAFSPATSTSNPFRGGHADSFAAEHWLKWEGLASL